MTKLTLALATGLIAAAPVFAQDSLSGPDAFADISDEAERSAAMFTEMGKVLTHPRCVNCHPVGDTPTQGDDMQAHSPPLVRGDADFGAPGMTCNTCHGPQNVALTSGQGSIPGHEPWMIAPVSMPAGEDPPKKTGGTTEGRRAREAPSTEMWSPWTSTGSDSVHSR